MRRLRLRRSRASLALRRGASWGLRLRRGCLGAFQSKDLGFVVLDGAEESAVIGGAISGNFFQDEIQAAGGGQRRILRGILGSVGGEVAADRSACGNLYGCSSGDMNCRGYLDIERSPQVYGGGRRSRGRLCRWIGKSEQGENRGEVKRLLRPVHKFRLRDFILDDKRIARLVRIGRGCVRDLPAETIG